MTKREVRVLALAELALTSTIETVWDIGAGTGSVAVEIARLAPQATIYGIEKTAIGCQLIERNRKAFGLTNLIPIQGAAPQSLSGLPQPDRVFIGGSGAQLLANLDYCWSHLKAGGGWCWRSPPLNTKAKFSIGVRPSKSARKCYTCNSAAPFPWVKATASIPLIQSPSSP